MTRSEHSERYTTRDSLGRVREWPSVEERLWRRVDRSGGPDACWEWQGYRNTRGYGQIGTRYARLALTHRVAHELVNGPIPEGLSVLHGCDNPPCCNPKHLRVGTHLDNSADAKARGRLAHPRNEASGKAKLTDEQVAEIRRRRTAGESCKSIAADFGVHPAHVSRVTRHLRRPADHPPEVA